MLIDNAIKKQQGQTRAIKDGLGSRYKRRIPRDHQSTAFPWPVLEIIRLQSFQGIVTVLPGQNLWRHVLDGATEGVRHCALIYRLFAQPEVC